ncbi:hypothetical protein J8273_1713 [Carpediemonas membranifera]|uniref:Uncharacterized protein n=1 Tax=Carpediemonas membranifera TaxID=201153 RepID=A0A8J6B0I4_9EUKA|nr:hypothetical protein J8273_1713 [Carpediemonas membranifera]|eukprot:KAG9396695.1 hypothetical protein J8273_1713 [Carpediemonas membranifera]
MENEVQSGNVDIAADSTANTLVSAYALAARCTGELPGDVPRCVALAFKQSFPSYDISLRKPLNNESRDDAAAFAELLSAISKIPPLSVPSAQGLLNRARSILTIGPTLSMNLELAEGEELPVALHTLLQGTVWACLMQAGADPDFADAELKTERARRAKPLWFLCKKTFFCHQIAEKDGEASIPSHGYFYHRGYAGRRFSKVMFHALIGGYLMVRIPRIVAIFMKRTKKLAVTTHGVYEIEKWSRMGINDPTRLTFKACPQVAQHEASLPPWQKHRLVKWIYISDESPFTFMLTPVGLVVEGRQLGWFVGRPADPGLFTRVPLPRRFAPEYIISNRDAVVVGADDHQLISGDNAFGQLGLGHSDPMAGLAELPFVIRHILASDCFNVFLTDTSVLFAGQVTATVVGLLPGLHEGDRCNSATPVTLPRGVDSFYVEKRHVCWTIAGADSTAFDMLQVPMRAAAFAIDPKTSMLSFQDGSDRWFGAATADGRTVVLEPMVTRPMVIHTRKLVAVQLE